MARTLTTAQRDALESPNLKARHGVVLELDGGTVAFWDELDDWTYDGVTYTGAAGLGKIQPVTTNAGLVAAGVELELSGLDQSAGADPGALYASLDDVDFHGRAVSLYRFYFDADSGGHDTAQLIFAAPLWAGFMDRARRTERGGASADEMTAALNVSCESHAMEYGRAHVTYRSNENQQSVFAGDEGFSFTPGLRTREIYWGRFPAGTPSGNGAGGTGRENTDPRDRLLE